MSIDKKESVGLFGTEVFGYSTMKSNITLYADRINVSEWLKTVPEAYEEITVMICHAVLTQLHGSVANPSTIDTFIGLFQQELLYRQSSRDPSIMRARTLLMF